MGDVLPNALAKAFETDPATGKPKNEEAFKAATAIISAALTSATGGDLAQTISAGMITQNAVANNYLGHVHTTYRDTLRAKMNNGTATLEEKQAFSNLERADQLSDELLKQRNKWGQ